MKVLDRHVVEIPPFQNTEDLIIARKFYFLTNDLMLCFIPTFYLHCTRFNKYIHRLVQRFRSRDCLENEKVLFLQIWRNKLDK